MTKKNIIILYIATYVILLCVIFISLLMGSYSSGVIFQYVFLITAVFITIPSLYLIFFKKEADNIPKPSVKKDDPIKVLEKATYVFTTVKSNNSAAKATARPFKQTYKSRIEQRNKRQEAARILKEEKELDRLIALEEKQKKTAKESKNTRVVKGRKISKAKEVSTKSTTKTTRVKAKKTTVPKKTETPKNNPIAASIKKRVNFSTYNVITSSTQYPIIRKPIQNSIIRSFRLERNNRKGFKEVEFYDAIKRRFSKNFEIIDNAMLAIGTGTNPYEPDIAMVSIGEKNIYIDIEIDEPYAGVTRKLTHCYPEDVNRDNFFVDRGWFVIRFSEYQIHHQIKECLFQIAKVVSVIDANYNVGRLSAYKSLIKEPNWDTSKARFWESINYRESYLNHIFKPYKEPKNIIDTALTREEKAEERLVKPQAYIPIAKRTKPKASVQKKIEVKPVRRPVVAPVKKVLDSNNSSVAKLIEMAVNKNYAIEMTYTNWGEETSTRKISQLKYTIDFMNKGYAYKDHFTGFCHNRLEERSFKVSRIEYMKILN